MHFPHETRKQGQTGIEAKAPGAPPCFWIRLRPWTNTKLSALYTWTLGASADCSSWARQDLLTPAPFDVAQSPRQGRHARLKVEGNPAVRASCKHVLRAEGRSQPQIISDGREVRESFFHWSVDQDLSGQGTDKSPSRFKDELR